MKKSRLLEIVREEISSALEASYAGKNAIPDIKKDPEFNKLSATGKMDVTKELATGGTVELEEEKRKKLAEKYQIDEEIINEMASIKQLKSELEKQGKEAELKAIKDTEKTTLDALKKDPTITSDGRLKGYVSAFKKELKNTHNIDLQTLLAKTAANAEGKFNDDIATNTIEKDAANQITGKEVGQRGRKASEKPAEEKPAKEKPAKAEKASKSEPMDDEDKEAAKAADSDETAKELGSTPEDKKEKFNLGLKFINKYKDDKLKIDAYLKKAKDEYKLPKTMMDDLKRAAGRGVE